jgi:hypothetical protein
MDAPIEAKAAISCDGEVNTKNLSVPLAQYWRIEEVGPASVR